jgi:hypothetical protein
MTRNRGEGEWRRRAEYRMIRKDTEKGRYKGGKHNTGEDRRERNGYDKSKKVIKIKKKIAIRGRIR